MSPDDFSKEQLMAVCTIYMDRCTEIRGLLTAQLAAMPDLKTCKSVEEVATTYHAAYADAIDAMITALEHIDGAAGEMMEAFGPNAPEAETRQ